MNFKWPAPLKDEKCPIYIDTLETIIWSVMWKILSFVYFEKLFYLIIITISFSAVEIRYALTFVKNSNSK